MRGKVSMAPVLRAFDGGKSIPCVGISALFASPEKRGPMMDLAEREGFEPSVRYYRTPAFQASPFDRSGTSPEILRQKTLRLSGYRPSPPSEADM